MARWPVVALVLALGCGPIAGASDVDDAATSSETTAVATTASTSAIGEETGDGGWAACPSARIDEPFVYRGFCLTRDGVLPNAAGRLGIGGARRFAFIGGSPGAPWSDETTLIGWDGVQIAEERFETAATATVWIAAAIDVRQRDALVGDALVDVLTIDNSTAGLEPVVKTTFPGTSRPPVVAIDLDGDGIDDLVVGDLDGFGVPSLKAYRWNGAAWAYWGRLPPMLYGCPATQARRVDFDGEAPPELAIVESCSGNDVIYVLALTDEPLVFTVTLGAFRGGAITNWQIADLDGDGRGDMISELLGSVPRRVEVAIAASDDTLSVTQTIDVDDVPHFVDEATDCTTQSDPWTALHADDDGRAELMCGRTIVTSPLDEPIAVEAIPSGTFGSEVEPHVVAHDVSGDGVDDVAISGRDEAGEPRAFVLISGQ